MAAFAAVFILAVSCTSDMFDQRPNGTGSDSKYAVSFSLGNRHVQTRGTRAAADVSGYERETAITLDNTHHMYAVIFNASDKKWFKTVEINSSDYSNGTFTFDMGQGGDYYMYLVANTVETTKLTDLTAETTEDDFFQIIDETPISDAGIGTTDFLMVSGRQHVNIDLDVTQGPTTTDLDAVLVYRRATRIDIDGSGVTGLQIKKVVMNKRYKDASYLVRADNNNAPAVAPSASGDGYVTTTYQLNGTATTNLIAVTATEQNATGAKVDDDEWQGVIYCYENPTENDTELEITCTIGNVERTTVVPFGTTPVKANTLYTVQLSVEETPTSTAGELSGSITVKDWENVTLTYANLTDTQVPNFTVVSGATASGTNPAAMRVVRTADSDIVLEVTSTGVYGSEVAFLNRTGASYNFSAGGGTITRSSTVTYNESGQIVETFTIHIPEAMAAGLSASDCLTFAVSNAYNSDSKRTFQIQAPSKYLNPLYYVAENNVKSYNASTKVVTLETNPAATGSSYTYSWSDAMSYFAKQTTSYDEYWDGTFASGTPNTITDGSTDFKYHLPCAKEWVSIVPVLANDNDQENMFANDAAFTVGGVVYTEPACVFGYSDATKTATAYQSYWSTYSTADVRYAIRFLGTDYCSVWKYQFGSSKLVITSKLIEPIEATNTTALSAKMTEITNANYDWTADEENGVISRTFYAVGYRNNSDNGGTGTADYDIGTYARYWSTTEALGEYARFLYFRSGGLLVSYVGKKWGFSVRLFRDQGDNSVTPIPTDPGVDFADVTSTHKGWYIAKNGKAYQTMALVNQYSTAVGYICYTGAVEKYFNKFVAIALHDAHTSTTTWSDAQTYVNTYASNHPVTVGSTTYNTMNMQSTGHDGFANGSNSQARTGELKQGWRLPSVTDWRYIFQGLGGPSATSPAGVSAGSSNPYGTGSTLLSAINTACGNTELQSSCYWSSSGNNSAYAWVYNFYSSYFDGSNMTDNRYVRAVFAY